MEKTANTYGYVTLLSLLGTSVSIMGVASIADLSSKNIQLLLFASWSTVCFVGARAVQKHAPYPWARMPFWGFGFATRRTLIGMYGASGVCALFFIMTMFL